MPLDLVCHNFKPEFQNGRVCCPLQHIFGNSSGETWDQRGAQSIPHHGIPERPPLTGCMMSDHQSGRQREKEVESFSASLLVWREGGKLILYARGQKICFRETTVGIGGDTTQCPKSAMFQLGAAYWRQAGNFFFVCVCAYFGKLSLSVLHIGWECLDGGSHPMCSAMYPILSDCRFLERRWS